MFAIGMPMTPELGRAIDGHARQASSRRWRRGRATAATSTSPSAPCDVDAILPAETCERLAEVKREWDPDGMIRANHEITVAAG